MSATTRRIARNTAWFTVGSILQKAISFGYFTLIAMVAGVTGTGRYFFALTFAALFAVAADFGISSVLTREVARDRTGGMRLAAPAFLLKGIAALLTVLVIAAVVAAVGYDPVASRGYSPETQFMIAVAVIAMVFDSIHLGLYALLRGIERVHYEAIGLVVGQFVLAASGVAILVSVGGLSRGSLSGVSPLTLTRAFHPAWFLAPYLLASVTNIVIAVVGCARERLWSGWTIGALRTSWRWLLRTATPFALTGELARVYTYVDTFLLSLLASEVAVGYYSTPFKIAFAFQFIPLAFVGALYPAMSAIAVRDRAQLGTLFVQSVRALWVLAIPIAFGIGALAGDILPMIYGEVFRPSILPLRILLVALPFIFANFPAGYLLNACDRQIVNTKLLGVVTLFNVALNIALIPPLGAVGAALSAAVASIALTIGNGIAVARAVPYPVHALGDAFLRITVAALTMSAVVFLLHELPLAARIAAGVVTYGAAALGIRAVRWHDLRTLASSFRPPRASPV